MRYPREEVTIEDLKKLAKKVRINIIKMLTEAGSGHPGGSLSSVEILLTLFYKIMHHTSENPFAPENDIFVLSKGHGVPALYAVYAETGYIEEKLLLTLRKLDSPLQGHPDKQKLPCLTASTGSLGQGLSIAQGYALAAKYDKTKRRVYCLLGDGECQEGQIWEGFMSAGHYKIDNLTAIIDYNKAQIDGLVKDVMDLEPLKEKLKAFKWEVFEVDGHNFEELIDTFKKCKKIKDKPQVIIAHTVKGKGVSFMEADLVKWHGVVPKKEEAEKAIRELSS